MIAVEHFMVGERDFTRTFSNSGRYVVRDGISYISAEDPAEFGRTYTEGDLIQQDGSEAEEILNILTGGAE